MTNTNKQTKQKNRNTPWLLHRKHKHAQKLQEHIRTNKQPPGLHLLKEDDIRCITDIMLQIEQQSSPEQKTPEKGKETHKCPTCHYEGEQEHHLTRHRRKNKMQTTMGTGTKQGWKRQNANMQRSLQNKTRTRKTQSLPQS